MTTYNNDDIYQILNEEIGVDQDKIKVNVDKIDTQMSILVETLKKMQVQLNILQNDNKTLKAENTAIISKIDSENTAIMSKLDSIEQDILLTG
jgi:regulator of replication initiation timing